MKYKSFGPMAITLELLLLLVVLITFIQAQACRNESAVENLHPGVNLSTPLECSRTCKKGQPPKTCYYKWTLEAYTVGGRACEICTPHDTIALASTCQCVLADGVQRVILTANRRIPGPTIDVCMGDRVIVDVINEMPSISTAIHWHGVFQKGYQYYDGVPFVTQCPIDSANTFRYDFVVNNAGTHFWHGHGALHKLDGLHGKLIVREPKSEDPSGHLYDKELAQHQILVADWMHELSLSRFPGLRGEKRGQAPESALINGKGQYENRKTGCRTKTPLAEFTVKSGLRYRFRFINAFGTVCPAQFNIENHVMTAIATDGEAFRPVDVNTINSFSGERYDFVINANQPPGIYWIQLRALGECAIDRVQQLAILRYEGSNHRYFSKRPTYDVGLPLGVVLNPIDGVCNVPRRDAICINQLEHAKPIDKGILKPKPDIQIVLSYMFTDETPQEMFTPGIYDPFLFAPNNALSWVNIDNITYASPPSPPLSQIDDIPPGQICNDITGPRNCDKIGACKCTHRIDIPLNAITELVLIDGGPAANLSHPFHMHGYAFNVVGMGRFPESYLNVTMTSDRVRYLLENDLLERNMKLLPRKDTLSVPFNGYIIIRFRADNPGEWLYHCHFLYHIIIGMNVILHVGEPDDLPPIPAGFPKCGNFLPPIRPM